MNWHSVWKDMCANIKWIKMDKVIMDRYCVCLRVGLPIWIDDLDDVINHYINSSFYNYYQNDDDGYYY